MEIYDPSNNTWITGPGMPSALQDLGAVSLNGSYTLLVEEILV